MNTEKLPVYNSKNQPLGFALPRTEVHKSGLWHRTLHCWVIYREYGEDYILFQQRSGLKDQHPGKLDTTAAGHYSADDLETDKFREIEEELGLKLTENDLIYTNVRICVQDTENGVFDREFQEVYFFNCNKPIELYRIQFAEIQGLVTIKIDEGLKFFTNEVSELAADLYKVVGSESDYFFEKENVTLSKSSFIWSVDNYNLKALILAKRILGGEKYISI